MTIARQERLARNEAFFRDVNERISEVANALGDGQDTYEFLCECSDPTCTQRIELTRAEYEHVRAEGTRFVLAPGHAANEVELVVEREDDHIIVEKDGRAGEVATELDPRAD